MKKLMILIFIVTLPLISQDKEPNPWEFVWGFSTSKRPFVLDSFPQTSIMTGGQWSGSTRMNNALKNNATTAGTYSEANATVETPLNLIIQPKWFDANYYQPGYFGAVMMQYEPTLPISSTNQGKILRPDDESNPIFGFRNRKGTILNNPAEGNYSNIFFNNFLSWVLLESTL